MHSGIGEPGIVVGIDGSPDSNAALRWAVHEATMRNVALTLAYAATPLPGDDRWCSSGREIPFRTNCSPG